MSVAGLRIKLFDPSLFNPFKRKKVIQKYFERALRIPCQSDKIIQRIEDGREMLMLNILL